MRPNICSEQRLNIKDGESEMQVRPHRTLLLAELLFTPGQHVADPHERRRRLIPSLARHFTCGSTPAFRKPGQ